MRFDSKSVILHRGVGLKNAITIPIGLRLYNVSSDIWNNSIILFNKKLDTRQQVTETICGIRIDILRLCLILDTLFIQMFVKEDDIEVVKKIIFTLSGRLIFSDEFSRNVENMIIDDILYGNGDLVTNRIMETKIVDVLENV